MIVQVVLVQFKAGTRKESAHFMNRIRFMEGEADFRAATRQERLCFAAECGLGRLGHTGTPDGLEQPHEKNFPVLLQNVAPTPLGTHEHSRVLFFDPKTQNPV